MSYLKAEFYRFSKKKSFLGLLILFTVAFSGIAFMFRKDASDLVLFSSLLLDMSPMLIGIALFVMIFTDDIGAHSTQIAIGFGIARWKLVIFKIIEMIIMFTLVLAYAYGLANLLNILFSVGADLTVLHTQMAITLVNVSFYSIVAALVSFVIQKSSTAIIMFVLLISNLFASIAQLIFSIRWVATTFPKLINYIPFSLINDIRINGWAMNNIGILSIYALITLLLSIILFNKTELEF